MLAILSPIPKLKLKYSDKVCVLSVTGFDPLPPLGSTTTKLIPKPPPLIDIVKIPGPILVFLILYQVLIAI